MTPLYQLEYVSPTWRSTYTSCAPPYSSWLDACSSAADMRAQSMRKLVYGVKLPLPRYKILVGSSTSTFNGPQDHDGTWSGVVECWHANRLAAQKLGYVPWRVVTA